MSSSAGPIGLVLTVAGVVSAGIIWTAGVAHIGQQPKAFAAAGCEDRVFPYVQRGCDPAGAIEPSRIVLAAVKQLTATDAMAAQPIVPAGQVAPAPELPAAAMPEFTPSEPARPKPAEPVRIAEAAPTPQRPV